MSSIQPTSGLLEGKSYYDTNYGDIDLQNSPNKIKFYVDLVKRFVPLGSSLFELGVGCGHFLEEAAKHYKVAGCDINNFGVNTTLLKCPNANVRQGSYEVVERNANYQAVVCWDVLEHMHEPKDAIQSLFNSLPVGGVLIAVVPVYDGPLGWLVRLLDNDPTHYCKWGRKVWLSLFSQCGFRIEESGGILRKLVGRNYLHFTSPQWLLKDIGSAIYVVTRKFNALDGPRSATASP